MRSMYLILILIGFTHAAMQQQRSPVYQPKPAVTTASIPTKPVPQDSAPVAPLPVTANQPIAQAREGTGPISETPNAAPSQNYVVYYYPEYRNVPVQAGGQPYATTEPGFWSRIPWVDVGYVATAVILMVAGGTLVYNGVGTQVKARTLRELQDLTLEDASRMARKVFSAIEKFQNMNMETQ